MARPTLRLTRPAPKVCGRYGLFAPPEEIARLFGVAADFEYVPRYNVAPSQHALVALAASDGPRLGPLRWGFHVGGLAKGRRQINARSETVHSSPAFRTAFSRRRCLIPASGFYEWRPEEGGKVPYWIHSNSNTLFVMAGIWGRDPQLEGSEERQTGEAGFTILTRSATPTLKTIHDRMPILLRPDSAALWLDRSASVEVLRGTLAEAPVEVSAYPVSTVVNSPANDEPECIQPVGPLLF